MQPTVERGRDVRSAARCESVRFTVTEGRGVGGAHRPVRCSRARWRHTAIRVLRAGLDVGLTGPVTSRAQRDQAATLVAGHGRIVAEFFDTGQSRTLAWARRPQAAALVAALADLDRGWDAIVIGAYERAFYGGQPARIGAGRAGVAVARRAPNPRLPGVRRPAVLARRAGRRRVPGHGPGTARRRLSGGTDP